MLLVFFFACNKVKRSVCSFAYSMLKICLIGMSLQCVLSVSGCATATPRQSADVCGLFKENPDWYKSAKHSEKRWGVPVPVQMAIIHQESHFVSQARPPREYLLGFIPWFRPSTAYGYAQVLDDTWHEYKRSTGRGGGRDDFDNATDFVGWYADSAYRHSRVPKDEAYDLYLAYHEGAGGYAKKTYLNKKWLMAVAQKVADYSDKYAAQLMVCEAELNEPWWHFW